LRQCYAAVPGSAGVPYRRAARGRPAGSRTHHRGWNGAGQGLSACGSPASDRAVPRSGSRQTPCRRGAPGIARPDQRGGRPRHEYVPVGVGYTPPAIHAASLGVNPLEVRDSDGPARENQSMADTAVRPTGESARAKARATQSPLARV
jgi:hypothetical protein